MTLREPALRKRISWIAVATVVIASELLITNVAAQSTYPDKPIRLLVGASTPETVARLIAPKLGEALGKPAIVETAMGAGGNLAAERVAKSAADGYTFYVTVKRRCASWLNQTCATS